MTAPAANELPRRWLLVMGSLQILYLLGWTGGPFLAAGTIRWAACWIYFGVLGAAALAHRMVVGHKNAELLQRRKTIGAGTKRWDLVWNLLFWPLMIAAPIVAGFGIRLGWSVMPWPLSLVGALLVGAGFTLSARAMSVNPHFEGTVRIQTDVGHGVIEAGPYRRVRHPGYAGLCLWALGQPFLLLSWAALVAAGVVVVWLSLRTALEDTTLRRELPGYLEYTRRTPHRLVPGVW